MLLLFAPGAPREDYFETLGGVAESVVLSDEEKIASYLRTIPAGSDRARAPIAWPGQGNAEHIFACGRNHGRPFDETWRTTRMSLPSPSDRRRL